MAAISHGADAVYIGANRFGARAAAGNSVDDISKLCQYAHQFGAKVYVTVNTIIYEQELQDTQQLITDLARIGVDALLVQDMATLQMHKVALREVGHAPALHASTQCDTRTAEKVAWLHSLGFSRAVLARELSVDEIKAIHEAIPDVELEVFVHGALCVSYSGQCYASQCLFHRSANRGECAQVCRMQFDLVDANDRTIVHNKYLLSMKDLCQIDHLEELADAGASSFKIEGRLKDTDYVKNVVAAYSRRLDRLIDKRPGDYRRASCGHTSYTFKPDLKKTFNRGYTTYFLHGRQPDIASMDTPKALGEFVGQVKEIRRDCFTVAGTASFANGDGLCFLNDDHMLEGFRVNRAAGNHLYPQRMPRTLRPGMSLYRNNDEAFEKQLSGDTARRVIGIDMTFGLTPQGFTLSAAFTTPSGHRLTGQASIDFAHQQARSPQTDNIRKQLSRLGNTIYEASRIDIEAGAGQWFVPSSLLADLRRNAVDDLSRQAKAYWENQGKAGLSLSPNSSMIEASATDAPAKAWQPEYKQYPYLFNVANHVARDFYREHGLGNTAPAYEEQPPRKAVIMQCRHCIRYSLGYCVRRGGKRPTWKEPLTLRLGDGRRLRLEFKCDECQMNIISE